MKPVLPAPGMAEPGVPSSSLPGDGRAGGALRLDESCEEQFAGTSRLKCIGMLPMCRNVLARGRKLRLLVFIFGETTACVGADLPQVPDASEWPTGDGSR